MFCVLCQLYWGHLRWYYHLFVLFTNFSRKDHFILFNLVGQVWWQMFFSKQGRMSRSVLCIMGMQKPISGTNCLPHYRAWTICLALILKSAFSWTLKLPMQHTGCKIPRVARKSSQCWICIFQTIAMQTNAWNIKKEICLKINFEDFAGQIILTYTSMRSNVSVGE